MISGEERTILRDLAKAYRDLCDGERNQAKLARWRNLNNMSSDRPLVFCNDGLLGEDVSRAIGDCKTSFKGIEYRLRRSLWRAGLGDDRVFFPWFTVRAEMFNQPEGVWGVPLNRVRDEHSRGWRRFALCVRIMTPSALSRIRNGTRRRRPSTTRRMTARMRSWSRCRCLPCRRKSSVVRGASRSSGGSPVTARSWTAWCSVLTGMPRVCPMPCGLRSAPRPSSMMAGGSPRC